MAGRLIMIRTPEFDGLRGIAISLVLWHHLVAAYLPLGSQSWLGLLRIGTDLAWCGVDLFFVISGYFIGGILIDHRRSPRFVKVFYLRRSLRILPLYFLTLVAVVAAIHAGWSGAYHNYPWWIYFLFLTNFALAEGNNWDWGPLSVLWSLAVEEQFYLAAPWVARLLAPTLVPWIALGLIVAAPLVRLALNLCLPEWGLAPHVLMPARMDTLAFGILIAWGVRAPTARPCFAWLGRCSHFLGAAGIITLGLLTVLRFREGDATRVWFGYTLLAMVGALLVAITAGVRPPLLCWVLSFRPLVALGRHSYFIYLWHMLLGASITRLFGGETFVLNSLSGIALVAIGIAATWIAAALSWHFIEEPLIDIGRRHAY